MGIHDQRPAKIRGDAVRIMRWNGQEDRDDQILIVCGLYFSQGISPRLHAIVRFEQSRINDHETQVRPLDTVKPFEGRLGIVIENYISRLIRKAEDAGGKGKNRSIINFKGAESSGCEFHGASTRIIHGGSFARSRSRVARSTARRIMSATFVDAAE
jgi:hypothetical protein